MADNFNLVYKIISRYVNKLSQNLKKTRGNYFIGSIRTGTWMENQNMIIGFISISPHQDPEEETIDVGFRAEINELINIEIDICRSDGELLKLVTQNSFPLSPLKNLVLDINYLFKKVTPVISDELDKIIEQNLPPRYREI